MRSLPTSFFIPTAAAIAAGVLAACTAALQAYVLGKCDPKLGCLAGVQLAGIFAAMVTLLLVLVCVCFAVAGSALSGKPLSERLVGAAALVIAVVAPLYVTWPAWSY